MILNLIFTRIKLIWENDTSIVEIKRDELKRLILEGWNISFEELKCNKSDLSFNGLENGLKECLSIDSLNKDILKTLELHSNSNGYINAALLLSDNNFFLGIDMIRFGLDLNILNDRRTLDNMSILKRLDEAMNMFKQYYTYEKNEGS